LKLPILIASLVLVGFVVQGAFAETEMTGTLKITDIYSTDPVPYSYLFFFQESDQTTLYRLNPDTLPANILDWGGEKVRIY
jgi:hypothetical protein